METVQEHSLAQGTGPCRVPALPHIDGHCAQLPKGDLFPLVLDLIALLSSVSSRPAHVAIRLLLCAKVVKKKTLGEGRKSRIGIPMKGPSHNTGCTIHTNTI